MRAVGLGMAAALAAVAGSFSLGATSAAAATCTAGTESDFNGDGIRDIAVADPEASVNDQAGAGLVRVVLGGGKGTSELSQALPGSAAGPEAGDKFGYAMATYDANADGCTDLVIGAPYEDVIVDGANQVDAGLIHIIHGSPTGIGSGSTIATYSQASFATGGTNEPGDLFAFSVAAGKAPSGKTFVAAGAPGEDIGTAVDAGVVQYWQGTTNVGIKQDDPGVPGVQEANDRFGASLATTDRFLAIGIPGEAIGTETFAGSVAVFSHTITNNYPTVLTGFDENVPALVSGTAEKDDRFGTALALLPYRPQGAASETDVLLAVGVPNEDVGNVADAGAVTVIHIKPTGQSTEVNLIDRLTPDVEGEPVVGDFFGQRVVLANTSPGAVGTASTVKLSVSVPNQEVGAAENAGAIHVLPGLGSPGADDKILSRGDGTLPDAAEARDFAGMGLWASSTDLYVGVPSSKSGGVAKGAVYVAPWSLIGGGAGTVQTFKPGVNGLPDTGKAFGSVIR
ncbi:VCBS repeat-containing protein [Streptomyces atratus]|uniref:VCBS repeat-containing protein n=1 Tax=Streptomyces atratus TaxID=1893 RepID=UPI0036A63FD0